LLSSKEAGARPDLKSEERIYACVWVFSLAWYFVRKGYWKRRGIDLTLAWKELPPA